MTKIQNSKRLPSKHQKTNFKQIPMTKIQNSKRLPSTNSGPEHVEGSPSHDKQRGPHAVGLNGIINGGPGYPKC